MGGCRAITLQSGHYAFVESVDVSFDVEADGRCVVKLQTPSWEVNLRASSDEFTQLTEIRTADWSTRRSLHVGEVAGAAAYWSSDGETATIVVGDDDETWDVAVAVPLHAVDEIVRLASHGT